LLSMKEKVCSECGKVGPLWKSSPKLCQSCSRKYQKPINKISEHHKETLDEYKIAKEEYFKKNLRICKVRGPNCTPRQNINIHHMKSKAYKELYLNTDFWLPCCNNCNSYIEEHSEWAYEKGFKLRRNEI
jgi:hypothetical protein